MKKILAMILTITMAVALFTGCAGTTVVIGECTCPADAHTAAPAPAEPTPTESVVVTADLVKTGLSVSTNISKSVPATC